MVKNKDNDYNKAHLTIIFKENTTFMHWERNY